MIFSIPIIKNKRSDITAMVVSLIGNVESNVVTLQTEIIPKSHYHLVSKVLD